MRAKNLLAVAMLALAPVLAAQAQVVTIYSADGLHDGTPNWYETQFDAFTKATGIKVQYVEGGSGGVVERVAKEASNPQADVLVTLPPFIRRPPPTACCSPTRPPAPIRSPPRSKDTAGLYVALVNNYMNFIYNAAVLKTRRRPSTTCSTRSSRARSSIRRPARPATAPRS